MKKRLLAFFLVMNLAFSVVACGRTKNEAPSEDQDGEEAVEEKETYQFKIWVSEGDISENTGSWVETRCDMFAAKYQDDEVLFDYGSYPEEEAAEKMIEDRSQAPDIFIFNSSQTDELVENRLLTRLWGETEDYVLSSNTDSIAGLAMYQGKVYGIPISANPYILYYDKRVFTEEDVKSMDTILAKGVLAYPLEDEKYLQAFYEAKDVVEVPEELQNPEDGEENGGEPQEESAGEENGGEPQEESAGEENGGEPQESPAGGENEQGQPGESGQAEQENIPQEEVLAKEDVDEWLAQFRAHANVVNDSDGTVGVEGLKNETVQAVVSDYNSYQQMKEILGVNLGMAALPVIQINGMEKQMRCVWETLNIGVNPDCENFEMTIALATYLGSADSQQMHYDMSGVIPVNLTAVQTLMDLDLTHVIAQIADKENPGWNIPPEDEEENE